ncbi:glycine N-acyltransferase-like protein 3 isoform X2 [Manacus candei]|uniref:glycine N-acyltransferase-like protein 3 isoform X2 n=2 Tax=Manacus candei TaxID=415023 RepID=UPI002226ED1A|nr:glycine N-acyltransferase-like protein 3 isoform X2 [Manacus candei]
MPPKAGGTHWPVTARGGPVTIVTTRHTVSRLPLHSSRTVAGTMQILTSPAQLQRLEGILKKSLPLALPVYGAVLNITRGNPGDFEVLVDKWPNFGAVLARPRGEVPVNDSYWNTQTAFYRDLGAYRALLETPGCQRWDAAFIIIGLQDGVTTVSQDLARAKGVELDITEYYTYMHPDPSTMPEPRLDPGVRLGSLLPSHVDLLNETWPYGGNARSRRYLAELLGRFPHVCVQDGAGEPLSWVLTDHFGTGAHGFTLPAHRRRGHMQVALTVAARRAQARGFPTYGHTALQNGPMQQLQELLGHQRLPGICRYILHNPGMDKDGP